MRYEAGQANRLGNRQSNEDRFAVVETPEGVLLILADGMGGHTAGALAAEALVKSVRERYLAASRPLANPGRFLVDALTAAHEAVLELESRAGLAATPGTTGVLCLVQGGNAYAAHVGDSRFYLFRDGLPLYRSRDHSYVEQLFRRGEITRAQADRHPRRNQVTRCIGCQPHAPKVDLGRPVPLEVGDVVLLCSDGLWSSLDDARLGAMLREGPLPSTVDALAGEAERNAYPNSDNVSVVALRLLEHGTRTPAEPAARPSEAPAEGDRLRNAIEQIEQVFREYEKELKR